MKREEIFEYVKKQYGTEPEYLWSDSPQNAVLRHTGKNRKWYGLILNVSEKSLGLKGDSTVDILNVKCQPDIVSSLQQAMGFLPAYHMNKKHWITILLDGSVPENRILDYLDWSYDLTDKVRNNMPKRIKKVTDIFSYVPAKQLSLDELENMFRQSVQGTSVYPYTTLFTEENIVLDNAKLSVCKELHIENKSVAYIAYNKEIVAIIGYLA